MAAKYLQAAGEKGGINSVFQMNMEARSKSRKKFFIKPRFQGLFSYYIALNKLAFLSTIFILYKRSKD